MIESERAALEIHKIKRRVMATRLLVVLAGWLACSTPTHAATLVEVMLVDKLDEPRGFCLDIVGSQRKATPERGLQAHTCYSYQGKIAVDQGFDGERLKVVNSGCRGSTPACP